MLNLSSRDSTSCFSPMGAARQHPRQLSRHWPWRYHLHVMLLVNGSSETASTSTVSPLAMAAPSRSACFSPLIMVAPSRSVCFSPQGMATQVYRQCCQRHPWKNRPLLQILLKGTLFDKQFLKGSLLSSKFAFYFFPISTRESLQQQIAPELNTYNEPQIIARVSISQTCSLCHCLTSSLCFFGEFLVIVFFELFLLAVCFSQHYQINCILVSRTISPRCLFLNQSLYLAHYVQWIFHPSIPTHQTKKKKKFAQVSRKGIMYILFVVFGLEIYKKTT